MELYFNSDANFTRWVVRQGILRDPLVVIDVGVQGGEEEGWYVLGDYLVVHGFDALEEAVETLRRQKAGKKNLHYHPIAIGNVDEDKTFYFNQEDPFSSSFFQHGENRFTTGGRIERARKVPVRRLDTLFAEGVTGIHRRDSEKAVGKISGGLQCRRPASGKNAHTGFSESRSRVHGPTEASSGVRDSILTARGYLTREQAKKRTGESPPLRHGAFHGESN